MRLPRPYIPLRVRVQVAERQLCRAINWREGFSDRQKLAWLLAQLFGGQKVELHHRPALMNREMVQASVFDDFKHWTIFVHNGSVMRYVPDANDPDYLIYLPTDEHDIETRVRGQGAQLSDLAIARKRKRSEAKRRKAIIADWYTIAPRHRTKVRLRQMLEKEGLSANVVKWPVRKKRNFFATPRKWPKRKFPKRERDPLKRIKVDMGRKRRKK